MCWTNILVLFLMLMSFIILLYYSSNLQFDILVSNITKNLGNEKNNKSNNKINDNETFIDTNNLERLDKNPQCPMYVYYNKTNYFMIFKNLPYRAGVNPLVFSSLDDVKSKITELKCPTVIIDSVVDSKINTDVRDNYKYICNRKVGANIYNLDKNIFDSQYQALQNKLELINDGSAFDRYDIASKSHSSFGQNNLKNDTVIKYNSNNIDEILDDLYKRNDTKQLYNTLRELLESKDIRNQQSLDVEKCQLLDMGKTLNIGDSLYRFNDLYNNGNIENETNQSIDLNITNNDVKDVIYQHYMSNKFLTPENDAKIFI